MTHHLNHSHKQHSQQDNSQGFLESFLTTLRSIFTDKGVILMLVIAPIIYGFFYPWPYNDQIIVDIPVGIVDYDNSKLSHTIMRYSSSSPRLEIKTFDNEQAAKEALWNYQIAGYLVIPPELEKNVYSGRPAHVSILGNGGYFILNKYVQTGFTQAVATVSAGIEVKRHVAHGERIEHAKTNTQAVPLRIDPLYNPIESYGVYIVPAVAILILQQTLLMGTAMLIGTWAEKRQQYASLLGWLGRICALSFIGIVIGAFYFGWIFNFQGYPRGHNPIGAMVFLVIFTFAVSALGCLLGLWFRQRERSLQILIFSSLPIFFLSGYPWPTQQLPEALQYLRWVIPTSSGMNASVQLNQMGASLVQVSHYLYALALLFIVYFSLLIIVDKRQKRKLHSP
ncbi:ABC transporter permease [Psychrobacter sp. I-STPA6b]|uniref:ABC transporter permease n=1 Tax=Psychrobacter sp. I-STPA6b TaxID=2585718 RepID=UPI001D0CA5B9|nr:ABC transporter permease [Psychrobacter sp. I-STPA6b]